MKIIVPFCKETYDTDTGVGYDTDTDTAKFKKQDIGTGYRDTTRNILLLLHIDKFSPRF